MLKEEHSERIISKIKSQNRNKWLDNQNENNGQRKKLEKKKRKGTDSELLRGFIEFIGTVSYSEFIYET